VDKPLLHQVASGDEGAVKELTRRYAGLVYSLARRMCLSTSEIEDAVQEVFIALWQSAGRFDPAIAGEDTFVSMVARRRLIDRRRRAIRRSVEHATEDFSYTPARAAGGVGAGPSSDGPGGDGLRAWAGVAGAAGGGREISDEARLAGELFATLRPEQQRVIQLAIGHGHSHEQISQLLGLPLGTVKTHVRRGLLALREAMAARGVQNSHPEVNPRPGRAEPP
jgi:RNA polymerase sigma-70 factor (ECF subfamily)